MPVPSGNSSSRRIGNGFHISKTRKSIKPARKGFQASGAAMSVTNCPATSSMTTNCGSFRPAARATMVAAGIPINVTTTAAMIVAQTRFPSGIRELANAHKITVAKDPQVPGPGLRRPVPKKVATSVAQIGAGANSSGREFVIFSISITPRLHLQGYLAAPLRRHRQPETRLHTRRSPTYRDRSTGSGRRKRGSRHRRFSSPSCRSDSGA